LTCHCRNLYTYWRHELHLWPLYTLFSFGIYSFIYYASFLDAVHLRSHCDWATFHSMPIYLLDHTWVVGPHEYEGWVSLTQNSEFDMLHNPKLFNGWQDITSGKFHTWSHVSCGGLQLRCIENTL
jgi:hypothetical protein